MGMPVAPPIPLDGSTLFDPWRIRAALAAGGVPAPPPRRGPTRSEMLLWEALRDRPPGWVREHATGPYRLDFFCPTARLAVEVDGGSHYGRVAGERDELRDRWHERRGIGTFRVSARHVEGHLEEVLQWIERAIEVRAAPAAPDEPAADIAGQAREAARPRQASVPAHIDATGPAESDVSDDLRECERELEAAALVACRTVLPDLPLTRRILRLLVP